MITRATPITVTGNLQLISSSSELIISGHRGKFKRKKQIGTIRSWGPQFRISFQLKVNRPGKGWLVFKQKPKEDPEHPRYPYHGGWGDGYVIMILFEGNEKMFELNVYTYLELHPSMSFNMSNGDVLKKWHRFDISLVREGDGKVGIGFWSRRSRSTDPSSML